MFIAIYITGEIIENKIAAFSFLPPDIGSQIHVSSAIFFTIMMWLRFYSAEKTGKKMVENNANNSESNSSPNMGNN